MMIFLKRKFVCYFKNNFNINTIIFKRISLQISIAIDKYKNDNKILMINFDVFLNISFLDLILLKIVKN